MTPDTKLPSYLFWVGVGLVLLNVLIAALAPNLLWTAFNGAAAIIVGYSLYHSLEE